MHARVFAGLSLLMCIHPVLISAAPPNDNWENRTLIPTLPFSESLPAIETATVEATDPEVFCVQLDEVEQQANSVWYRYSPGASDAYVNIDGLGYDTLTMVFEGSPESGFRRVPGGCNDDAVDFGNFSQLRGLRLRAGGDYSILVARFKGGSTAAATLAFSISASPLRQVTKTADSNDGLCDADCSLREAIVANAPAAGGAILVPAGRYLVPGGLILPDAGVGIYGAGMDQTIIDAATSGRVITALGWFHTVHLSGLSLVNGTADLGGAIRGNSGYTVLDHVAVRDNTATTGDGGGAYFAGSQYSSTIIDGEFTGNRALAGIGGGAFLRSNHSEVINSTFSGNYSGSTVVTTGGGGAVLADQFLSVVRNSTFSGNNTRGNGGGLSMRVYASYSKVDLYNVTVVNNTFNSAGAITDGVGLFVYREGVATPTHPVTVKNSVLHNNRDGSNPNLVGDCWLAPGLPFASGYNLVGVAGNCGFTAPGDVIGLDPLLLPLAPIGSIHPVHVPGTGSPLIDSGDPNPGCEATDQRGVLRPQDGDGDNLARCDIGAVERTLQDEFIFANGFQ